MYLKGKKALIIDDLTGMRSSMRATLASLGIDSCDQAGTAREAVDKMRANYYDIVICDYYLGDDTDGQQILEMVRRNRIISRQTLFIIVTAERTQDRVVSAADFLPDDYLVKPFTADTLGKRALSLLEKREYFQEVHAALDEGNHDWAIGRLGQLCANKNKYWIDAMRLIGDTLIQAGRHADAILIFEEILKLKEIPWAVMGKVKGLKGLGKADEAKRLLGALLQQHTEYLAGYDMLATLCAETGDAEEAQKQVEKALAIVPAMHRQKRAGKLALERGDIDKAQQYLSEVIERGKYSFFKDPEDYTLLSHVHMEKGDTEQARSVLDLVGKRFAATPEVKARVQVLKAMAWQKEGKPEQAKALLEPLLANPDDIPESVKMDLAKTCFMAGDNEIASRLLSEMMQNNHDNAALKDEAVKMLESVGMGDQVEELVGNAIQELIALNNRGALMLRDGKLEEAAQLLVEAAEKLPRNATIVLNAAYALLLKLQDSGAAGEDLARVDRYMERIARLPEQPKGLSKLQAMRQQLKAGGSA